MTDRIYNVPLRKEFQKAPKHKRAKKAIVALKQFLLKHMKVSSIKLSKKLNEEVWKNGMKNPPHHVKVEVDKLDDTAAEAKLFGEKSKSKKEDSKKEKDKLETVVEKEVKDEKSDIKKMKENKKESDKDKQETKQQDKE